MPFHAEHHSYPAVPFHQLPRFHAVIRDRLRVVEPGYARFHARFAAGLSDRGFEAAPVKDAG